MISQTQAALHLAQGLKVFFNGTYFKAPKAELLL